MRVGRSNKKAFCYLLAPPLSVLPDESRKRLQAIEQFSDLGSGIQIAMRDLDIRGAGDLLGGEQSGFISELGFDMYQKILAEAVRELKEESFAELFEESLKESNIMELERLCMSIGIPNTTIGRITNNGVFSFNDNIKIKVKDIF